MPKWTKFAAGWMLAAVFALALSWGAVASVRDRVIQPSIQIPATVASATSSDLAGDNTTSEPTVIRLEPEVVDTADSTIEVKGSSTTTTPTIVGTTSPTATSATTTTLPSVTTPTTLPSGTSTTTTTEPPPVSTTTTTTTTVVAQTQTSSYTLTGGVVTINHSPGVVMFVSAIPQPGYSTDQRELGPEEVRIRFESENHTSDFRAVWSDGELEITQNETGED